MKSKQHHPFKNLSAAEHRLVEAIDHRRTTAVERFPLMFTLLGAFGLVATFYGFEKVIDEIELFVDKPWLLLAFGLILLVTTGGLYKYLER